MPSFFCSLAGGRTRTEKKVNGSNKEHAEKTHLPIADASQPIPIADAMTPSFARANGAFPDEQRTRKQICRLFGGAVAASPLFRHVKVQIRDAKAVRFFLFLWPSSRDRDPWKRLGRPCVLLSCFHAYSDHAAFEDEDPFLVYTPQEIS